jgi:hypothetical protein
MGQMSSNFGEIVKKLIPVFGGKARQRATQAPPPPPPRTAPGFGDFTRGENAKLSHQTPTAVAKRDAGVGGGGNSAFFK